MTKTKPPRLGQKLFALLFPAPDKKYFIEGIEESFRLQVENRGRRRALLWYWKEIFVSVPLVGLDSLLWGVTMLQNYLKIVFRLIRRKKLFSFLNLMGLTVGLTCGLFILLYVDFELNYDSFHKNKDKIYRVYMHQPGNQVLGSSTDLWVTTPPILKPTWKSDLPEIEKIANVLFWDVVLKKDGVPFVEDLIYADPEFLEIFTFPLVYGDPATALNDPFSLLITRKEARKLFGNENPVGQTIQTRHDYDYKITGVLEDIPKNSHLEFGYLASFNTLYTIFKRDWESDNWLNNGLNTYLTLPAGIDRREFDRKLRKYDLKGFNEKIWSFHVQPLKDIHFNRDTRGRGDIRYIYIFSAIGLFILGIACFNFVNLSTARSSTRAKEVGLRKVVGAHRRQLIRQLLGESFLFTLIALLFSLVAVIFLLPAFNAMIGKELSLWAFLNVKLILGVSGIAVLVGLLSGSYPALVISAFQPVRILRGRLAGFSKGTLLFRNSLVVVQFALSIFMIVATITLYHQLQFIRNKNLGYDKDQVLTFGAILRIDPEAFKGELLKNPDILEVSFSSDTPNRIGWSNIPAWEGKDPQDNPFFYRLTVDYDFFDLYGLEIVNGRSFSRELGDKGSAYILNEAAVKALGFEDPIGQPFGFNKITGRVVGVVKDFHFESLHKPITPLGIGVLDSRNMNNASVKISSRDIGGTLGFIEKTWRELNPEFPFTYSFLDDRIDWMYRNEQKMAKSFNVFALIAIFIACLGLFGLASFNAEQKTKEIGIRKILGATGPRIIVLLTRDFVALVALANLLAWPLAWYAMSKWLESFAYRIDLNPVFFVAAAAIALLIATVSVGFQFARATRADPVDCLRYE